ncbi:hypothetical protein Lesp02_53910 [Lentzea sp. NBRC 105346]|uniref:hypothetical protein n=1 Tax=Lentzea sp. NBRC 105346 TaxID=3032205 RepID=UPI0024A228CE|nr:hypothetical protein [Lentzea sp. NBRC 105346]GLZ33203.1 hypothetical protein Lesp02_53910 [Lentzea sp. NBRC 105346]
MAFTRRENWTVECGVGTQSMLAALFVRDTLALSVDTTPDLPGLDPGVPVIVPPGVDRAAAARDWPGWWTEVLEDARAEEPERVHDVADTNSLLTRPALRDAVLALRDDFYRYRGTPTGRPPLPVGDVVRAVESRLGRPVRPFRLVINEVPVRGYVWERIAPGHVVASTACLHDPSRSAPRLRAVVEDLA